MINVALLGFGRIGQMHAQNIYLNKTLNLLYVYEKIDKLRKKAKNLYNCKIEKDHKKIKDSTLILLSKGEELKVKAASSAKFLVISGKPINEEIARGGPFVMNTKAEILQAVQDYHNGTFVK